MPFLKNAWYCVGWSDEIADRPLSRTFLNEPVVLLRHADGTLFALHDRCPHRFAPLSLGKYDGERIECPYHGLQFDMTGSCIFNPHGNGAIPQAASVKRYPVAERQGIVWIWMGDPKRADPSAIVDLPELAPRPGWSVVHDHLLVKVHYELVTDNLMDLSHARYLHPLLAFKEDMPEGFRVELGVKQDGEAIWATNQRFNQPVTPFFAMLWETNPPPVATMRAHMRWNPPSNLFLDVGMAPEGGPLSDGPSSPIAHLLTPETDVTTHYFWVQARDRLVDRPEVDATMRETINHIFQNEDETMIIACQQRMATTDLFSLKPVLLSGDGAAVRVRRALQNLIAKENCGQDENTKNSNAAVPA